MLTPGSSQLTISFNTPRCRSIIPHFYVCGIIREILFFPVSTKTLKIFFFLSSKNISESFLTSITISPSIYSSFHSARVRGKGKRRSTAAHAFKKRSNESEFIKDRYKYGSLAVCALPPALT